MLENLIEKYKIENSLGEAIGRIKDFVIDVESWRIMQFEVSPSILKKDILINIGDIREIDHEEKLVVLKEGGEPHDIPTKLDKGLISFHDLKKLHVSDKDGKKVGKIYHLEVPIEKLKTYKVWKILIKVGIKERRLRLSTSEIHEVGDEVTLRRSLEQYKDLMTE